MKLEQEQRLNILTLGIALVLSPQMAMLDDTPFPPTLKKIPAVTLCLFVMVF